MFANIVVLQESPSDRFCALEILLLTYLLTYLQVLVLVLGPQVLKNCQGLRILQTVRYA